jgi:biopolymer transport protein ExbD
MRFAPRQRRRSAPSIIIVSLIDVLVVVLIFLMVTTSFKQQPSIKLSLPESKQSQAGANEGVLIVTVPKEGPMHLNQKPVTLAKLQELLIEEAKSNPKIVLSIRADNDAPFGQIVKVMDAAKMAQISAVTAFTKPPSK